MSQNKSWLIYLKKKKTESRVRHFYFALQLQLRAAQELAELPAVTEMVRESFAA